MGDCIHPGSTLSDKVLGICDYDSGDSALSCCRDHSNCDRKGIGRGCQVNNCAPIVHVNQVDLAHPTSPDRGGSSEVLNELATNATTAAGPILPATAHCHAKCQRTSPNLAQRLPLPKPGDCPSGHQLNAQGHQQKSPGADYFDIGSESTIPHLLLSNDSRKQVASAPSSCSSQPISSNFPLNANLGAVPESDFAGGVFTAIISRDSCKSTSCSSPGRCLSAAAPTSAPPFAVPTTVNCSVLSLVFNHGMASDKAELRQRRGRGRGPSPIEDTKPNLNIASLPYHVTFPKTAVSSDQVPRLATGVELDAPLPIASSTQRMSPCITLAAPVAAPSGCDPAECDMERVGDQSDITHGSELKSDPEAQQENQLTVTSASGSLQSFATAFHADSTPHLSNPDLGFDPVFMVSSRFSPKTLDVIRCFRNFLLLLLTISSLTTSVPLCCAVANSFREPLSDLPGMPLDHSPVVERFYGSARLNGYSSYRYRPSHYHRHHRRHVQRLANHRQALLGDRDNHYHFQKPQNIMSTGSILKESDHPVHLDQGTPVEHRETKTLVVDHLNRLDERNQKSGKRVRMVHHPTYDEIKVEFYGPHTPFISISSLENLLAEENRETGVMSENTPVASDGELLSDDDLEQSVDHLSGARQDPTWVGRKIRAASSWGQEVRDPVSGRVPSVRMYAGGRGFNIPSSGVGGTPLVVTFNQNYTEWPGPGTFEAPNGVTGVRVANFGFYEHKPGDVDPQSNYTFEIQHDSDRHHDFYIGKKDGTLRINKHLDRERESKYLLKIGARDEAGNTGWAQMQIVVLDVNDNAPDVHSEPAVCNVTENKDPGQVICKVYATDPDEKQNGPPFLLQVPSNSTMKENFRLLFDQSMYGGNGGMTVTALKRFDRESKKQYDVPIFVKDSGSPPQSAIRFLRIHISDVNDNPMTDGSKSIHVYSYKGQLGKAVIGTVYVTDADDFDQDDKTYAWVGDKPEYFDLDTTNGTLWIEPSTPEGNYKLKVKVTDFIRTETGIGSVTVLVEKLEEEAFLNSGSIRIRGTTAEEFITQRNGQSKYALMQNILKDYLGLKSADSVQIFSIMPHNGSEPAIVDIRFAAHESPYKQASLLNGKIEENRSDFSTKLGIEILQVGIDECFSEWCEGGCTNVAQAFTEAQTINAGELALVGVRTTVTAQCTCPSADVPDGCSRTACKNGGLCHKTETKPNFFCECRGSNLKGAQCQGISRSFTGAGYIWLDPIASCKESHISLEFISAAGLQNAVIMYNGVMDKNSMKYSNRSQESFSVMEHEWVWVGIVHGKLAVDLNLGSGPGSVILTAGPSVNDNQWHRVDILRTAQYFDVILDQCRNAPDVSTNLPDYTKCRASNNTQGVEKYLNLNSVLQVGGISSKANQLPPLTFGVTSGLNGCIRNLKVDEQLYDLQDPPLSVESTPGCSQTDAVCGGAGAVHCSGHGSCLGSSAFTNRHCVCDPGYQGSECERRAQWKKFNYMSYIQYRIPEPDKTLNTKAADIKILFSPQTSSGTLSYSSNSDRREFMSVEMEGWSPSFKVNNGGDSGDTDQVPPVGTTFPGLKLNQTYWINAQKWPGFMSMALDMLPGIYTSEFTSEQQNEPSIINYDQDSFFLGGLNQKPNNGYDDFEGCIADYRIDDYWLPLDSAENVNYASITAQNAISNDCSLPNCTTLGLSYCLPPMICMDFWKGPFCTCPDGAIPQFDDNYALIGCTLSQGSVSIGITTNAVVAILVSLLVLILLVLILVIWMKRRTDHEHDRFRPDDDIREGIVTYNEEGGGEEDQDQYDIKTLRKPVLPYDGFDGPMSRDSTSDVGRLPTRPPGEGDIGDFIGDRLADADRDPAAPPYDELRVWADEGDGLSSAGSLSSLASDASNDLDWDTQLNSWGPRFGRLADMYGGQDE